MLYNVKYVGIEIQDINERSIMRIIEEYINGPFYSSPIFDEYFGGLDIVVADIETTGLSPKSSAVILGGAVFGDGADRKAVQFFGDTTDDEAELLQRYAQLLSRADVIVTYNGQRFDIPFLVHRMKKHGLDTAPLEKLYSVDMYRVLKYHSHLPEILPNMKQKTVEVFLGDSESRTDEIDGAQSVELYNEYTRSTGARRGEILDYILLHNRDDIVRLSDMMRIIKTLDLHEIMYSSGFPMTIGEADIHIEKMKISKGKLVAEGSVKGDPSGYTCFGDTSELQIDEKDGRLKLEIMCDEINEYTVADLRPLNADIKSLQELGGYESGYLILKSGKDVRHHEANLLVRTVLYNMLG